MAICLKNKNIKEIKMTKINARQIIQKLIKEEFLTENQFIDFTIARLKIPSGYSGAYFYDTSSVRQLVLVKDVRDADAMNLLIEKGFKRHALLIAQSNKSNKFETQKGYK